MKTPNEPDLDNCAPFSSGGLIIRQQEPRNLEAPFVPIESYLTPTELFYIRSHFPTPKLELVSYRLHVDGAVRNPFSLSYNELRDMPSETRVATLECAGNSRSFLSHRLKEHSGNSVQLAMPNGPVCR